MSEHKAIREAAKEGQYYTAIVAKDDLRALLADLDAVREALTKIANADCGEGGCYYTNRANINIARAALKGGSHD